eukprot:542181-Prymnesium_polylepis.1
MAAWKEQPSPKQRGHACRRSPRRLLASAAYADALIRELGASRLHACWSTALRSARQSLKARPAGGGAVWLRSILP